MTTKTQYPLSFDADGNPLTLPPEAVAWRVRRGGGRRGRPRSVFDPETGLQLDMPLGSTIEDLIDRGCVADRYRLEAVDGDGRIIPGIVAICEVPQTEEAAAEPTKASSDAQTIDKLTVLVEKVIDSNTRTMEAMASAFGTVRPAQPPPIVLEHPPVAVAEQPGGMKPEQIMQMIMQAIPMFAQAWKAGVASVNPGGAS